MMQITETKLSNAAHKAWATRRAKAALAATTASLPLPAPIADAKPAVIVNRWTAADLPVAKLYVEPAIVAETEFRYIEIWLDDAIVGCGQRRFVVLGSSTKKVSLFCIHKLVTTTVDRVTFDRCHSPARKVNKRSIAEIMRRNIALADRVNERHQAEVMPDGGAVAQNILAMLEGRTIH